MLTRWFSSMQCHATMKQWMERTVFISHCSSLQSTQTALTVNETLARWPFGDSRDQVICEGAEPPRDPVWSSGDTFQPARWDTKKRLRLPVILSTTWATDKSSNDVNNGGCSEGKSKGTSTAFTLQCMSQWSICGCVEGGRVGEGGWCSAGWSSRLQKISGGAPATHETYCYLSESFPKDEGSPSSNNSIPFSKLPDSDAACV